MQLYIYSSKPQVEGKQTVCGVIANNREQARQYALNAENSKIRKHLLAQMEVGGIYHNKVKNIEEAFDRYLPNEKIFPHKNCGSLFMLEL